MGEAKERPILFSGPMVRAILRGMDPKWQTRRAMRQDLMGACGEPDIWEPSGAGAWRSFNHITAETQHIHSPYGAPGDRLWVRETWGKLDMGSVCYRADDESAVPADGRWRPSIHMPKWASRLTLEVTEVRVQRLQEISEDDARAEGPELWIDEGGRRTQRNPKTAFRILWDSINGERKGCAWEDNPWVWSVSFRRFP